MKTNPETLKRFCRWCRKCIDPAWFEKVRTGDIRAVSDVHYVVEEYILGWNNPNERIWATAHGAEQPTSELEMVDVSDLNELIDNLYISLGR